MVWLVIGVILTMVFMQVGNRQSSQNTLDYSTFMEEAKQGHIARVKLDNNRTLTARFCNPDYRRTNTERKSAGLPESQRTHA